MDRQELGFRVREVQDLERHELKALWMEARVASGKDPQSFRADVEVLKHTLEGLCPDGCCGGDGKPPWSPTPQEWTVLAEETSRRIRKSASIPRKRDRR